jgi:hypothetical protein
VSVFPCTERDKLVAEASRVLHEIIEFSNKLLVAIQAEGTDTLVPLDKDLENAVGAKERAFGALAQHCKEHGC